MGPSAAAGLRGRALLQSAAARLALGKEMAPRPPTRILLGTTPRWREGAWPCPSESGSMRPGLEESTRMDLYRTARRPRAQSSIRRLSSSVGPRSTSSSGATRSSSEIARVTGAYWPSSLARQSRVIENAQVIKYFICGFAYAELGLGVGSELM